MLLPWGERAVATPTARADGRLRLPPAGEGDLAVAPPPAVAEAAEARDLAGVGGLAAGQRDRDGAAADQAVEHRPIWDVIPRVHLHQRRVAAQLAVGDDVHAFARPDAW